MTGFAFCPDDGPPRIMRYVEPGVLPVDTVCTFDKENNLLVIDAYLFKELDRHAQRDVLRTHAPAIVLVSRRRAA